MAEDPLHIVAVTGLVRDASARVLLVRVASRGWEMPGGQVEEGEDLVTALRREVEEESGCEIEVERLIGVYSKLSPPVMALHLFAAAHLSGEARAREDAVPEVGWFSEEAARRLVTHPPSAQRLVDALADADGVVFRAYRLNPYEAIRGERL
jgi:8-oxo-dGTP diphosphatase